MWTVVKSSGEDGAILSNSMKIMLELTKPQWDKLIKHV